MMWQTSDHSIVCTIPIFCRRLAYLPRLTDIRTWHSNIEQHASEGVNKILIGNKSDWTDKKAVTEEQGRALAEEFGIKFMETSAKVNEGVEEAFFTLARSASSSPMTQRLIDLNFYVETSKPDWSIRKRTQQQRRAVFQLAKAQLKSTNRRATYSRAAVHRYRFQPFYTMYICQPRFLPPFPNRLVVFNIGILLRSSCILQLGHLWFFCNPYHM
jgi:hypothetical protein